MTWLSKIATACCVLFFSLNVVAEVVSGTVVAVHDGDTLTLKNQLEEKKIRLAGIDACHLELSQETCLEHWF